MLNKKRILALGLSVVMSLMVGCTGKTNDTAESPAATGETATTTAPAVQAKELRIAFNQPETHPQFKALKQFGEKVAERTNGAYKISVYPNELLGPQRETMELVQSGAVDMSIVANSLVENFNKNFLVFNLPYLFDSEEHFLSVMTDDAIVGDLFKSTEAQGFITLSPFYAGTRNVYTKSKPVKTPEDLKGQKIRVMQSDTSIKMMEKMGGVATPMGQGEVYTAIQQGVLDGGENNELIYSDLKHAEVAKYYSYTKHLMMPDLLVINAALFNSMTPENQAIFKEEIKAASEYEMQLFKEDITRALEAAKAAGTEIIEPDTKLFQDRVLPLHEELLTTPELKALYEKVRAKAQ